MDFGIFIPCHRLDDSISEQDTIADALEVTKLAEQAGFSTAWFPEHHLVQYIACPSPLMLAVAAAARTRRIRVGTAILVVPYYDPRRLAGEIGLADILCDGRLEIGLGRGAFNYEFDRFGVDEHIAAQRLRDGMEVIDGLLKRDNFEYEGRTSTVVPKPLQRPHPPMWVACRSPDTTRWAIERGYNLLATPWREPFERVERLYRQFSRIADEVRPAKRPKFAISRMTYVGADDDEALRAMQDVQTHHRVFTRLFNNTATVERGYTRPDPVEDEYSAELLLDNLVAGSATTCVEKLRRYEQLGVDHFIMYAGFPRDHASAVRSIVRFAEHVMPHFAKSTAGTVGGEMHNAHCYH
jgi:alkanesulfonate monooxygenase SsuD/methylene tetrahydromethanopterin reductase-like flavin-dependent oxidoreductase (luciferase family)